MQQTLKNHHDTRISQILTCFTCCGFHIMLCERLDAFSHQTCHPPCFNFADGVSSEKIYHVSINSPLRFLLENLLVSQIIIQGTGLKIALVLLSMHDARCEDLKLRSPHIVDHGKRNCFLILPELNVTYISNVAKTNNNNNK